MKHLWKFRTKAENAVLLDCRGACDLGSHLVSLATLSGSRDRAWRHRSPGGGVRCRMVREVEWRSGGYILIHCMMMEYFAALA
jgi:hypothetical protein